MLDTNRADYNVRSLRASEPVLRHGPPPQRSPQQPGSGVAGSLSAAKSTRIGSVPRRRPGLPPGPGPSLRNLIVYGPGKDPLAFFSGLAHTYGDVSHVRLAYEHLYLLNAPPLVKDLLVTNQKSFVKGRGLESAKRLLGNGLLTSEGETHLRQRRLVQPAFHRDRIASYASTMTDVAQRARCGWREGDILDIAQEMMRLTLAVVGRTLFGAELESFALRVAQAVKTMADAFWLATLPFFDTLESLPIQPFRRIRRARIELDEIVYALIADRRRSPRDRGDLLSMLLTAQDEDDGLRMTDQQFRDEAMTLFLAGHETTSNALAWTWYLLSRAPGVEARLHEEIDRVLRGRRPSPDDLPALPFVDQVITESMRLYPPAWIIGRRAIEDYRVGDYLVPSRSIVVVSPYVLQRDPRFFADPLAFKPERWTPAFKAALPPFAYFPFGGGTRRCIGESFAWMELGLIVATIAQQWRFERLPDHEPVPQPGVTLRMKHGLKMTARRRSAGLP
jgi:cytochrome P450